MTGVVILFSFPLLCLCSHALAASPSLGSSNATADELALLSFKSMLSQGPSGLLVSWNISGHYCSWPGVVCGRRHPGRVVALLMGSLNLSGHISPFLGNLSFLKELNLENNQLIGQIPPELGHLSKLQVLNLSTNSLHGGIPPELGHLSKLQVLNLSTNSLQGGIPVALGGCTKMTTLDLSKNNLQGEIPRSLAGLPSIEFLVLKYNRLSGEIPPAFGHLTALQFLSLHGNMLSGAIPSSLGMLSNLIWLDVGSNNLTGAIPASIWNISSLEFLSFQINMLSGMIPPNAFHALPHLERLFIDHNQFHGHFPGASLANASAMSLLQLGSNFFSGTVPPEFGNLRNLKWLILADNMLEAKEPKDWEFITSLTNCSMVDTLELGNCKFGGVLPDSLSNLSTSLTYLDLEANTISGSIPKDIGNLVNLQYLALDINFFTGALPSSLGRLKNLHLLDASNNEISGSIPTTLGNLTEINYLHIDGNSFSGRIPSTLGSLTELLDLRLASNNFIGPIPSGLFNITTLSISLDLSHNILEGSVPQEIGNLKNLVEFHAESNKLTGEIPATLGECQLLQSLYLQNNLLNGGIPSLLSQLRGLQALDLSSNNLSGQIPKLLGKLSMLNHLNLSFNSLVGEVPNVGVFANATGVSIQGNGKLCGGITDLHLPPCSLELSKKKHRFPVTPVVISLIATLVILPIIYKLLTWHKKSKTKIPSTTSMQGHPLISYSQLVHATDGFSSTNLLGSGSFGTVYKGELDSQAGESTYLVAVKVLKLQTPGALKSFIAECEALRNLRHRNLVKIITACSSIDTRGNDFKALVFDFMPNGSLQGWLHPDTNEQTEHMNLNLLERIRILLDVANALDYLHCQGPAPVIHCDLKPSNVLLDAEMVAHVGDFGLAKILVETSSAFQQPTSSMGFRGTIGYAPPEYGVGNMVSTHGDIYSYGILVLETVTGKRPTDNGFIQGLSLREYVELGLHDSVLDVVDTRLSLDPEMGFILRMILHTKETLIALFHCLGLECPALRNCPRAECRLDISSRNCTPSKSLSRGQPECDDGRYAIRRCYARMLHVRLIRCLWIFLNFFLNDLELIPAVAFPTSISGSTLPCMLSVVLQSELP